MPFVKVYIHYIWSTKNRIPFLNSPDLRRTVWEHIQENAGKKGIHAEFVNGHQEHCHCLISLGSNQTIERTAQLLKGESSFWINQNKLTKKHFAWQDEYFAVSVSESMVQAVRNYIQKQEDHHRSKTFQEEHEELMTKFGFVKYKDERGGNF